MVDAQTRLPEYSQLLLLALLLLYTGAGAQRGADYYTDYTLATITLVITLKIETKQAKELSSPVQPMSSRGINYWTDSKRGDRGGIPPTK